MNQFTISQLQQFSGVKAHTIRIWEQRYKALNPMRSEGNTRYYDNHQLKRLLNIVSLLESDYKISELGVMSDEMLSKLMEEKMKSAAEKEGNYEHYISQLIAASTEFDEVFFEKVFSNCMLRIGLKETYTKVIYPMLNRIGLLWVTTAFSPAYEHFCSNLVAQKLHTAIDSLPPAKSKSTWLLFLPEDEFHEVGLLFSHYLIKESGNKVIYLGNNVPFDTLLSAVAQVVPEQLLLFLVHHDNAANSNAYIKKLSKSFSNTNIHLSGNGKLITQLGPSKEFNWIKSVEELEKLLH